VEITEKDKVQILLTLLGRRYDGIEKIRERVYNISIWAMGIFLAAAGLIVEGNLQLDLAKKIFLTIGTGLALAAILFYIKDLEKGFRSQFKVAVQFENLLGFSKEGFFGPEQNPYPTEWAQAGTKKSRGHFFQNTYMILYLGAATLLFAIWSVGYIF
jgi:hypothetical protein